VTHGEMEEKLVKAELGLREHFPGVGLLLVGVIPREDGGFDLHQVANMPTASVRTVLAACLRDVDAGAGERVIQ